MIIKDLRINRLADLLKSVISLYMIQKIHYENGEFGELAGREHRGYNYPTPTVEVYPPTSLFLLAVFSILGAAATQNLLYFAPRCQLHTLERLTLGLHALNLCNTS